MVSPTKRSPRVSIAPAYAAQERRQRRPQHRFNIKFLPFQLQPFMIAPVLPGETLKNLMIQAQTWSTPLSAGAMKNVGWWNEYNFFYVKHRDLMGYEQDVDGLGKDLIDMFVTGETLVPHVTPAGDAKTYTPPGGVNFTQEALKRIVEEYFRDEGEAWNDHMIGGLPAVKIYGKGQSDWTEKLTLEDEYEDRRVELDVDQDGKITVDEVNRAYVEWAAMKDAGLMDMDYEDWMRTYGVRSTLPNVDRVDHHVPEDIAHFREFSYPTNTVEPTTGLPATAVGWRVATRTNKSFAFPEPGWLIGLCTVRPKVYLGAQKGSVASMMVTRESWLPAVLNDQLDVSHLLLPHDVGPLAGLFSGNEEVDPENYWLDLRDLLNHGDQFVNYAPGSLAPFVALPNADANRRYATDADVARFFHTGEGMPDPGFESDGVVSLTILGRQTERGKNLVLGKA